MPVILIFLLLAGALYWIVPNEEDRAPIERKVGETAAVILQIREPY